MSRDRKVKFDEIFGEEKKKETPHGVYAFKRKKKTADKRVYEVGRIDIYIVFIALFFLNAIKNFFFGTNVYTKLSEYAIYGIDFVANILVFILPCVIFYAVKKTKKPIAAMGFRAISLSCTPFIVLSFFLLISAIATGKFLLAYLFSAGAETEAVQITATSNIILYLVVYAIIPAICEEIAFRGVLQGEISEIAGGISGITISALTFALIHFDLTYFPIYLISGFLLAAVMHITSSVIPCIIIHTLNNAFSLYFSPRLTFIASEKIGNAFIIVTFTVILFILLFFWLKNLEKLCIKKAAYIVYASKEKEEDTNTSSSKEFRLYSIPQKLTSDTGYTLHKFLRVLFSPVIIVAVILFFFISV